MTQLSHRLLSHRFIASRPINGIRPIDGVRSANASLNLRLQERASDLWRVSDLWRNRVLFMSKTYARRSADRHNPSSNEDRTCKR